MIRPSLPIIFLTCLWAFGNPVLCQKPDLGNRLLHKTAQNNWDNIDSILYESFIRATGEWRLESKYQCRYDEMNNRVQYAAYFRDNDADCWVNFWKDDYLNDAHGYLIQSVLSMWDTTSGEWKFNKKATYINNSDGKMLSYIYNDWDDLNGEWVYKWRGEFSLNDDGNTTDDFFFRWDTSYNVWVNRYKDEFSYDVKGNIIESTGYSWIEASSQWNPETRYTYEWDENGNNVLYTGFDWNETEAEWLLDNKTEITYNSGGNQLQRLYFIWNSSLQKWTDYDKVVYSYNDQDKRAEDLCYDWDQEKGEWIYDLRRTYYYHQVPTPLPHPLSNRNQIIYPNPARSIVKTDLLRFQDKITVIFYDSEGREVIIQKLSNPDPIFIGHLESGIYFYKIISGNEICTGKLLITAE